MPVGVNSDYHQSNSEFKEPCRYQPVGCTVRVPPCRLPMHESICVYKDRAVGNAAQHFHGSYQMQGDPNRLVECCFRYRGCMAQIPYWRKQSHEQSCNFNTSSVSYPCYDSDESDCRWAFKGCRIRPKSAGKFAHEQNCRFRDVRF